MSIPELFSELTGISYRYVGICLFQMCLCNIIVLSLPYVVIEQYRLNYCVPGNTEWSSNADKLFRSTRETILGIERWSSLFVENMNELVIVIATQLNTHEAAKEQYNVDIPQQTKSYHYPKEVFDGMLKYIEVYERPNEIFTTVFILKRFKTSYIFTGSH